MKGATITWMRKCVTVLKGWMSEDEERNGWRKEDDMEEEAEQSNDEDEEIEAESEPR